ncbi:MAG: YbhB/YbcL family Raf kinase inhibitor-like protein [Rhodobacteraceae bacterium]|nr:YbhB/YbcL family Raf kinase inhibitor-like protein [Paracoccaceae bacterium]
MKILIDSWINGASIPSKFAFGKIPAEGRFALAENVNPAIAWRDAPAGTKSFAIICHDPDVPSSGEDVNQESRAVSANLPRVDFFHWVLINISADVTSIAEGADSSAVTPKGKTPGQQAHGLTGINSYTDWFSGDPDMSGNYGGYDGPCPPWNDSIMHHYHFTVFALNTNDLKLSGPFTGADVLSAIEGHVLAKAEHVGTYSMNRDCQVI